MSNYDYVYKAYRTASAWNLGPDNGPDPIFTLISASQNLLVYEAAAVSGDFMLEIAGDLAFSLPLERPDQLGGTVASFKVFQNNQLHFEEYFPANTAAPAFIAGDYAFELSLLSGNDYFAGSSFRHEDDSDGIRAGDGNDTFIGYGSTLYDDDFYGEGGTDTSIYLGKLSEYTIERSDSIWDGRLRDGTVTSGYIVTDNVTARDDTDRLVSVERLQFSDVTLAFDVDGVAGQAYRIYQAGLNRQPDSIGLGYWIKELDSGRSLESVAKSFIDSAEFRRLYGANPSDAEFVELVYNNVLGRDSDAAGFRYWTNELADGLTRARLLASFSESAENITNVADSVANGIQYTAFLG